MINLGIINDSFSYNLIKHLFISHSISFVENSEKNILKGNTINLINQKIEKCDIIFSPYKYNSAIPHAKKYIVPYEAAYSFPKNCITFGFSSEANVTFSSINSFGSETSFAIYIQKPFKTAFQTNLVKFEFLLSSNNFTHDYLDKFLGCIATCLYLDLKFQNNEFIFVPKGERIYVQ